ncbi:MAG: hypothetical protein V2I27_01865 [Erythrobacter sp.]|jgi:hypothetical protein|nr:hypothetical protein [Erythrobacter sp.]
MRLLTILGGYIASSVAAMVVLIALGWIDSQSLGLDRLGHIAPLFVGGAAAGAAYALPMALPTILFTELTRFHSVWIFAIAGVMTGLVMMALLWDYRLSDLLSGEPWMVRDVAVICAVNVAGSLTYWLFAWRLYPPRAAARVQDPSE